MIINDNFEEKMQVLFSKHKKERFAPPSLTAKATNQQLQELLPFPTSPHF